MFSFEGDYATARVPQRLGQADFRVLGDSGLPRFLFLFLLALLERRAYFLAEAQALAGGRRPDTAFLSALARGGIVLTSAPVYCLSSHIRTPGYRAWCRGGRARARS